MSAGILDLAAAGRRPASVAASGLSLAASPELAGGGGEREGRGEPGAARTVRRPRLGAADVRVERMVR